MDYLSDVFYILFVFVIGYFVSKNNVFDSIGNRRTIDKKFKHCYIFKYPNHAEFHNKGDIYQIDFDEFLYHNRKYISKIKIIDRPSFDSRNIFAVRKEVAERRKIINELEKSWLTKELEKSVR
jgi:hypothetical protein